MNEKFNCAQCGAPSEKAAGHVNRSRRRADRLFCNRVCAGLARRVERSKAERVTRKSAYDADYRAKNRDLLKAKKHAYYLANYDPEKERVKRKARMPRHAEYCRRPEYRRWKQGYDRKHRAEKFYGPFAEASMLVIDLNREIKGRMTNHEIKWQNGTSNKTQFRRREAGKEERSRPRHRSRPHNHSPAVG